MRTLQNASSHGMRGLAFRSAGLLVTGLALLLCAPVLDNPPEPGKNPAQPQSSSEQPAPAPEVVSRIDVKLNRGDTLLSLLSRYGVEAPSAHDLIAKMRPLLNLRKLRPGKNVQLTLDSQDQTMEAMEVVVEGNIVRAKTTTEGWVVERLEIPSVSQTRRIQGTIEDSLYMSGVGAGLSPEHVLQLARIFEYDIDFFSDFKPGDDFAVVLEETRYADGRQVPRRLLAADLQADGKIYSAFHFTSKAGKASYYDSEGNELRSSFLRAPLSFSRISSRYSLTRRHPISRVLRPHRAIDYAAPAGTPVIAIGRGKVTFSGWRGGYGNCVEVRHPGGYSSRYGHFSRIAPGIRRGAEIDAGDVIGFVGQTGHATGPHLHFEFLQGNKKINFLAVKIPRTAHLAGAELARFKRQRDQHLAQLRQQPQMTSTVQAGL